MKKIIYIALSASFLVACSTSNDVVSNKLIQKRKHTKGWNIKKSKNYKVIKGGNEEDLAATDNSNEKSGEEISFNLSPKELAINTDNGSDKELKAVTYTTTTTTTESSEKESSNTKASSEKKKPSLKEKLVAKAAIKQLKKISKDAPASENLSKADIKQELNSSDSSGSDDTDLILLYVIAFFIPFLAVGIVTDWDLGQVLLNLVLCLLCFVPGLIHAFIVVNRNA